MIPGVFALATQAFSASSSIDWRHLLLKISLFQFLLTIMVAMMLLITRADSLASQYFFDHDGYLLIANSAFLVLLSITSLRGKSVSILSIRNIIIICLIGAIASYLCSFTIFHHYAISRDEQSAEFAATYLSTGRLGWPIPSHLRDLGLAMMPLYTSIRPAYWATAYLPVNSAIRAPFALMGDQWLASPALFAIGIFALWISARRIWPRHPHAATIAVVMAASSVQVFINAATPFAMTGHFALNAIWLAFFLRGDRMGHAMAILTGLLASGLHQAHFHIVFVLCFVIWLVADRRYRLAALYTAACIAYWYIWRVVYPATLDVAIGLPAGSSSASVSQHMTNVVKRLAQMQPGESLTRFLAWQNVLLLPLSVAGVAAIRHYRGNERVLTGCAIACLAGTATMILQDHGYGYRYLHPLIPCFCLLAAGGWVSLEQRLGKPLPIKILAISVAFAAFVTFPVATWRTMVPAVPYETAYRAARRADTDYLFVDGRAGAYLQDIVRVEKDGSGPVLLDLGYVPPAALTRLCTHERTMLFGENQARAFGIPIDHYRVDNYAETKARMDQMRRLGCVHPMPIG